MFRRIANIFTKPLGLDKLWHFSGELGLPNLRGRKEHGEECTRKVQHEEKCTLCGGHHDGRDAESDDKFDFDESAEEAKGSKDRCREENWP